jgi:hypothetical protein
MEKTISEVPKEVVPKPATICSTLIWSWGLFSMIPRRISEVRRARVRGSAA